jgi:exopolysaccharide biosynthesis polyprenyl glycosylphosphotransferase
MVHFKHQQRRKLFAALDFGSISLAIIIAVYVRRYIPLPVFQGLLPPASTGGFTSFLMPGICLAMLFVFVQYVSGIYDLLRANTGLMWLKRLLPSHILLVLAAFTYLYVTKNFFFPRSLLLVFFLVSISLTLIWRLTYFLVTGSDISEVVLIGTNEQIKKIRIELEQGPYKHHIQVKAAFAVDQAAADPGYRTLDMKDFDLYSKENPYTSVILAPSDLHQQTFNQVLKAAQRGVAIYAIPTIYEILLGRLNHLRINDLPLLELRLNPRSETQQLFKRWFDVFASIALIILLSIPMLIAAVIIKLTSPGPALYTQERVGKNGRTFKIFKFRSMFVDAEKSTGAVLASRSDPRVTWFGRFMRSTRIDELPQLFNILKGDMSFVGPRPERPVFVSQFEMEIPGYKERCRIRPGVTGLAQVSGNYETSADIKLKYDLAYVANQNMTLDLQILIRTLKTVLTRAGQ